MKRDVIVRDCGYDFSTRSLMSYRPVLRSLPCSLRRRWLLMRLRFDSPRVEIGAHYLPPSARRGMIR